MRELTLGSFNLHVGRGFGHEAPFYDVVAAAKGVDTDVLVLQEAWVPDDPDDDGNVVDIARALDYEVAATFAIARATCDHRRFRLAGRTTGGDGGWTMAVLSRLPVHRAEVEPLEPQLPRDSARRAALVVTVDVDGAPFTVVGTHLPLLKDPVWRLRRSLHAALPEADQPAAFAGDMNMWGWWVDRLAPPGWRRVVRGRTYPSHRPHTQTDHILVTRPVEAVAAEVIPQAMSDHRPIRATLRF